MRNKLEYIQLIDKYLRNVLSESDRKEFENRLKIDTTLQKEVEKQELLMEAIKRKGLKNSAIKGRKTFKRIKSLKIITVAVAIIAVAAFSVYKFMENNTEEGLLQTTEQLGVESLENQNFELKSGDYWIISIDNLKTGIAAGFSNLRLLE